MPDEKKDEKASESSTEGEKEKELEGAEDAGADDETSEEGDEKLPFHKHPRWKKLHGELKQFKDAGLSPLELKVALQRLQQYDRLAEEAEAAADKAEDDDDPKAKELAKKRKAAKKELLEIYPELKHLDAIVERIDTFYTSLERRATSEMSKLMKEAGLPTEAKNLSSMAEVISSIIKEDKDLYLEYVGDPRGAVRTAWGQFKGDFEAAATRKAAADLQKKKQGLLGLPKTHKGGVSSDVGGKPDKGPKNLNEARKRVEAKLAALE